MIACEELSEDEPILEVDAAVVKLKFALGSRVYCDVKANEAADG